MSTVSDIDNIEFKIVKESWNQYDLKGDIVLRARAFITRIAENKNVPLPPNLKPGETTTQFNFSIKKDFQIFAPDILKDEPTKLLPPIDQIPDDKKEEIEVLTYSEPWNIYEIVKNGSIVKMKLVVNKVWRIKDTFDNLGEPYCVVNNSPLFSYEPTKDKHKFA